MRHGSAAKGWVGVKAVLRAVEREATSAFVEMRSSSASSRSSGSVVRSERRAWSSVREFVADSREARELAMGCSSPMRLASLVSKVSVVLALREACSCVRERARVRRAGVMNSLLVAWGC